MSTGKTGMMFPIATVESVYQAYKGDYWEAATSIIKAIGYMWLCCKQYREDV